MGVMGQKFNSLILNMNTLTPRERYIFQNFIVPFVGIYILYHMIYDMKKYDLFYYHNKHIKPEMRVKIGKAILRRYLKSYIPSQVILAIWKRLEISALIQCKLTENAIYRKMMARLTEENRFLILLVAIFLREFYYMRKYERIDHRWPLLYYFISFIQFKIGEIIYNKNKIALTQLYNRILELILQNPFRTFLLILLIIIIIWLINNWEGPTMNDSFFS